MRKILGFGAFIGLLALCATAYAAGFVGIQDPTNPGYVAAVDSTGHLSTTGTATVSGNVTVVQPTGTNLHTVVDSAVGVAQGSTTSGQTLSPTGCRTLTSAPTDTTAQTNMPWCRTNGAQAVDLASINGTTVSTGTGAQGTGTPRVTVATDSATVAGSASLPAGTNNIGQVQPVPGTTGGLTVGTITAANSTNATNLKASAGTLYHITGFNNSATLAWVSFYNTAGTPSCGASIVYQMMIPANSTSGGGAVDDIPSGLAFSTGIGYCITTGIAGTGSVAASAYVVNFGYK